MRTIRALLAAAAIACPLLAGIADGKADEYGATPGMHHVRVHRQYYPADHFGYYWYQWGWRHGGTRCCWFGSTFAGVSPWFW